LLFDLELLVIGDLVAEESLTQFLKFLRRPVSALPEIALFQMRVDVYAETLDPLIGVVQKRGWVGAGLQEFGP